MMSSRAALLTLAVLTVMGCGVMAGIVVPKLFHPAGTSVSTLAGDGRADRPTPAGSRPGQRSSVPRRDAHRGGRRAGGASNRDMWKLLGVWMLGWAALGVVSS
jgi:hypothetical protein